MELAVQRQSRQIILDFRPTEKISLRKSGCLAKGYSFLFDRNYFSAFINPAP